MKILLINPPILSVLEPWYDTPKFTRTALGYLAAYLLEKSSHEVKIIDSKFEQLNFNQVVDQVVKFNPEVIGYTAFTNEVKPAAYLAALIKKALPNVINVIGGVHVTAIPVQTLEEFWSFDMGVFGEGEQTFLELTEALNSKSKLDGVAGLVYRNEDVIVKNIDRHRVLELNKIPLPAWNMMPKAETYFIQSQRGCPLNCTFCMNPNGKSARKRSVENIIKELIYLIEEMGAKYISFGDELFSVDNKHTHQLLDAMIENDIGGKIEWDVQTHVRYIDFELLEKFKKAKVLRVELGVETGDDEILKKMGKGTSIKMIKKVFKDAKLAGVSTGSFFLLGQPNETIKTIKKTMDFAAEINPDLPMFGIMTPYPATRVADMAINNEGGYKLLTYDWDEYNKQLGGALEMQGVSRKQLEKIQVKGYLKVFIKNFRLLDLIKFLWEYRHGGISAIKKIISGSDQIGDILNRPKDYHEKIYPEKRLKVNLEGVYENWKNYQSSELSLAKKS